MSTPILPANIDPRLRIHLFPEERVLWQGRPRQGSFFGTGIIVTYLGLILIGMLLAFGLGGAAIPPNARLVVAATCISIGLVLLITRWRHRANLWAYAVTDQRLVSVLGDRLIRSVSPEQLDRLTLEIKGDIVYWLRLNTNRTHKFDASAYRGPDGQFVGFHGQSDAHAVKAMIEAWRLAISRNAVDSASTFAETMNSAYPSGKPAGAKVTPLPVGVTRIRNPHIGLKIDMPSDWRALVSTKTDRPLRFFGITLLPKVIRETSKLPYRPSLDWNTLLVRAAPEAGLNLTLHTSPLEVTLESVLNDPWSKVADAQIISTEPALEIGPFTGFGVIRSMPAGAQIRSNQQLSAPSMTHQIWLEGQGISLEIRGYALEGQTEMQHAIEAMTASIDMLE